MIHQYVVRIKHTSLQAQEKITLAKMIILVAEDNKFVANQYKILLEKKGHTVITTPDGLDCLKKYKERLKKTEFDSLDESPFDLVLLDHNMPKKTGAKAAKEILAKNPKQKILFITGYQRWALEDETDDLVDKIVVLEKPFTLSQLERKVESLT
jgi:CheY-like chemotaxis protein